MVTILSSTINIIGEGGGGRRTYMTIQLPWESSPRQWIRYSTSSKNHEKKLATDTIRNRQSSCTHYISHNLRDMSTEKKCPFKTHLNLNILQQLFWQNMSKPKHLGSETLCPISMPLSLDLYYTSSYSFCIHPTCHSPLHIDFMLKPCSHNNASIPNLRQNQ